ncbi:carbohydrate-binding protein [uncultured Tenacibaculum sp.]|uniref:carbohydrate-binding protein n=1 Tax=uncultured Tenacibaculum sp. TaxID=174713 RepID=UPI002612CDDF|nr:carbohydrate-binding protein [uncultured Tenacibaculum sp.]
MKSLIKLLVIFTISTTYAQNIYVAKNGNDANSGGENDPFLTIAKACEVARPGNVVLIREGKYEETIKPSRSGEAGNPIVFKSYPGENVVISAMKSLSNWTADGDGRWKTTVNWDLGQRNFVMNGTTVLDLARWPNNTDGDRFTLNSLRNDGGSQDEVSVNAFLTDAEIPNWNWANGGSIMFYGDRPGSGWTTWRAWIKSQSSGRVNFDAIKNQNWIIGSHPPGDLGDYYLEGIKEALDYQNEWYFDATTSTLFVQLPGGIKPNDGEVQMSRREVTADLQGRSYIHIENLALFGGNVLIKGTGNKLNRVTVLYGSMTRGINPNFNSGINAVDIKHGSRNTIIEHSEIGFGDATGIWDSGTASIIKNNYVHDFDFLGSYDAPIMARGGVDTKILNNNISRGGRDAIQIVNKNSEVAWNDISQSNLIADDCALLYTINKGLNLDIHHNWFHDAESRGRLKKAAGIYLDNDAENVRIYRNVVWNVEWTNIQINWDGKDIDIFNNTLVKAKGGTMGAWHKAGTMFTNVKVWNNITDRNATDQGGNQETEGTWEPQSDKQNNLVNKTSFVDHENNDFKLKAGSAAIDFGREITGYTDGFKGASPDVGAYELGDDWIPGPDWKLSEGANGSCYNLPGESCGCTPVVWYKDADDDGLGDRNSTLEACSKPNGYVANNSDNCDDDKDNRCDILHQVGVKIEAEDYNNEQGVDIETNVSGVTNLGFIENNDFSAYKINIPQTGTYTITYNVASASRGGGIQLTSDKTGSESVITTIANTGGWQAWQEVSSTLKLERGIQTLTATFVGGSSFLFNVDWLRVDAGVLSVDDIDALTVKVYPNPSNDIIKIEGLREDINFSLFDIKGRKLKTVVLTSNSNEIHIEELPQGIYFLKSKQKDVSYKIIKK